MFLSVYQFHVLLKSHQVQFAYLQKLTIVKVLVL